MASTSGFLPDRNRSRCFSLCPGFFSEKDKHDRQCHEYHQANPIHRALLFPPVKQFGTVGEILLDHEKEKQPGKVRGALQEAIRKKQVYSHKEGVPPGRVIIDFAKKAD